MRAGGVIVVDVLTQNPAHARTAVFLAPVLGIVAEASFTSNVPTFGCCLLAACVASPWLDRLVPAKKGVAIVAAAVIALAGYQASLGEDEIAVQCRAARWAA